jgi:hypothetical protein
MSVQIRPEVPKGENMKRVFFENVMNKEKFYCTNLKDIRLIEGVEYLRVFRLGTQRDCLVKKDSLRKVSEPKK